MEHMDRFDILSLIHDAEPSAETREALRIVYVLAQALLTRLDHDGNDQTDLMQQARRMLRP